MAMRIMAEASDRHRRGRRGLASLASSGAPAEEGFLPKQDVSTSRTSRDLTMRNMGDPGQSIAIGAALGGVIAQLGSLLVALGGSRYRRRLGLLAAGIVLVICANSIAQIRLNAWQGAFFDAIEQRDLTTFGSQRAACLWFNARSRSGL